MSSLLIFLLVLCYSIGKFGGGPDFFDSTHAIVDPTIPETLNGKWYIVANSSALKIGFISEDILLGNKGGNLKTVILNIFLALKNTLLALQK